MAAWWCALLDPGGIAVFRFAAQYWLLGAALLMFVVVGGAGALPPNGPSPNVVVSQVYGAGGNNGATLNSDYVELFNRGTAAQPVGGWSVQYASATGTGLFGSGSNFLVVLPSGTSIP